MVMGGGAAEEDMDEEEEDVEEGEEEEAEDDDDAESGGSAGGGGAGATSGAADGGGPMVMGGGDAEEDMDEEEEEEEEDEEEEAAVGLPWLDLVRDQIGGLGTKKIKEAQLGSRFAVEDCDELTKGEWRRIILEKTSGGKWNLLDVTAEIIHETLIGDGDEVKPEPLFANRLCLFV